MKAKVIETGEIIDVIKIPDRIGGFERYWDRKNEKEYSTHELDFRVGVQMNEETVKPIDWEQRRYEIAKDVLAASLTKTNVSKKTYANICVQWADALIAELKKQANEENNV